MLFFVAFSQRKSAPSSPSGSGFVPSSCLSVMPSHPVGREVRAALFAVMPTAVCGIRVEVTFNVTLAHAHGSVRLIFTFPDRQRVLNIDDVVVDASIQRCGVVFALVDALLYTPEHGCWLRAPPAAVALTCRNQALLAALRRNTSYKEQKAGVFVKSGL